MAQMWAGCHICLGETMEFFLMAFIFPKNREAKSPVMREGMGRGCWTLEQQGKGVKSSFWNMGK